MDLELWNRTVTDHADVGCGDGRQVRDGRTFIMYTLDGQTILFVWEKQVRGVSGALRIGHFICTGQVWQKYLHRNI